MVDILYVLMCFQGNKGERGDSGLPGEIGPPGMTGLQVQNLNPPLHISLLLSNPPRHHRVTHCVQNEKFSRFFIFTSAWIYLSLSSLTLHFKAGADVLLIILVKSKFWQKSKFLFLRSDTLLFWHRQYTAHATAKQQRFL